MKFQRFCYKCMHSRLPRAASPLIASPPPPQELFKGVKYISTVARLVHIYILIYIYIYLHLFPHKKAISPLI